MEFQKDFENADTISIDTISIENQLEEEYAREIAELEALSKKYWFLHTSMLYFRKDGVIGAACFELWRTLVNRIGGSKDTWRGLGHLLGFGQDDLDYIMCHCNQSHTVKDDPVDVVLKLFAHNEEGTIDKVLDALVRMDKYAILKALQKPLSDLAECFHKTDSGYHSNTTPIQNKIIGTKTLPNDLPPALLKKYVQNNSDRNKPDRPTMRQPMKKVDAEIRNDRPILFLTYANDGKDTAYKIKYQVNNWEEPTGVQVVTLNDRKEEVYKNPEKFIREYFEKADLIVPIVSSNYLQEIKSHNPNVPNTSDDLDCKYVSFIYNLIINHYIHASGCMNNKVRSVLPQNISADVLGNITLYPDLMPWTYETNFDEQFKEFLKQDKS